VEKDIFLLIRQRLLDL